MEPAASPSHDLTRYLRALSARAGLVYAIRGACAAAGAGGLAVLGLGLWLGPVVTPGTAVVGLAGIALVALTAAGFGLRPEAKLGRGHAYRLLARFDAGLASRARSAIELRAADAHASPALIAAHAQAVQTAMARAPHAAVVPWSWVRHPSVAIGLSAVALSLLVGATVERAGLGARALLFPATLRQDGLRVAPIVDSLEARLVFPSYLEREPLSVSAGAQLTAPRGTTIELTFRPNVASEHGALRVGDEIVRMTEAPGGALFARFVARKSLQLGVRVLHDGAWYEDAKARALVVVEDHAPQVKLTGGPADGTIVQPDAVVSLPFEATDDHALASVDLAYRLPTGEEVRQRLWSALDAKERSAKLASEAELSIAQIGAGPGDIVLAWIEAKDGDVVSGPHLGSSRTVTLEVATETQELSEQIPELRAVLDAAIDVLAARLQAAIPSQANVARQRFEELREMADAWLVQLDALVQGAAKATSAPVGLDVDQLRGIAQRTRRELGREGTAYAGGGANVARWNELDGRVVAEHERDVLLLADMFAAALVDEARALTSELNDIKEKMRELLGQLKNAPTDEAKRQLLAEIAKAQRRLRELAQSLSRLAQRVPSEFINREAVPQGGAKDSMASLQQAIESGDMEAAERYLQELEKQIDELAAHVDDGGAKFREAHFGEQDRAMAQARNQIGMLAAEQERLAGRSRDLVSEAARKAQQRAGNAGQGMQGMEQLARDAERGLQGLDGLDPGGSDGQMLDRAQARARDAADALRTGDLAEARRMAEAARRATSALAESLDRDARMFPGHQGQVSERAKAAGDARQQLEKLQQQIDQAIPPLQDFMGEGARGQLRGDVGDQRAVRETAEKLRDQLGSDAKGAPLSPSGEQGLGAADDAMRRAERALSEGDAEKASRAQEEAAEQLQQLEQQMAQRERGPKGEQQGGERDGNEQRGKRDGDRDGDGRDPSGPVRIPGAEEFTGPVEMRRKVLDAMREQGPRGFESALQRYYQELLR